MKKYLTAENIAIVGLLTFVVTFAVGYYGLQQRAIYLERYQDVVDSLWVRGWPKNSINPQDSLHPGHDSGYIDDSTFINHSELY